MKTILSLSGLAFLFLILGATVFVVQKRQGIGEIAQVYPPSSVSVPPVAQSPSSPPATPPPSPPATPPPSLPPSPPATPTPSGLSVPTPIPTLGYILPTPPPVVGVPIIQATTPLGAVTQNNLSDWCLNNPDQCVADPAGFYRIIAGAAAPTVVLFGALTAPVWVPIVGAALTSGSLWAYSQTTSAITVGYNNAPPVIQIGLRYAPATLELAGGALTAYQCGQGNQDACMAGAVGAQLYNQQLFLSSAARVQDPYLFGQDAMVARGGGTYTSSGGQKLIINPKKDPALRQYLQGVSEYVAENRTSPSISRVELVTDYVNQTIKYGGSPVNPQLGPVRKAIYQKGGGTAWLGEFTNCRLGVCREIAAIEHASLAEVGKSSEMVVGNVGAFAGGQQGRHAWVEYIDTVTGQRMVADATQDFILPVRQAYSQEYGGVSNITREVFVQP